MHVRKQRRDDQFKLSCMALNTKESSAPQAGTYIPSTYTDKPPLHHEWRVREAREEVENHPERKKLPALLDRQREMMGEATADEDTKRIAEKERMRVLDSTPDLCGGAMDDLLAETRRLLEHRMPETKGLDGQ